MRSMLLLVAFPLLSCARPCEDLADRKCARVGESSEACTQLRQKARRAGADDQKACEAVLGFSEALDRN